MREIVLVSKKIIGKYSHFFSSNNTREDMYLRITVRLRS